jgi:anti-sigma B factor antagonist
MIAPRALIAPALLGPPPFEVHVRPQREAVHVCPVGELDLATTARLRAEVEELAAAGFAQVVIDLRELDFMDCSGVGLLIALARAARREGWRLSLFQGRDVRRLFALTGTLDALPFPHATPASPVPWASRTGRTWR